MKRFHVAVVAMSVACVLVTAVGGPAGAAKNPGGGGGGGGGTPTTYTASWTGAGTTGTGSSRVLTAPKCDANNTPYLAFYLTGTKATAASFTIGGQAVGSMTLASQSRKGNVLTFTYSPRAYIDLQALLDSKVAAVHTNSTVGTLSVQTGCQGVKVSPNCPNTTPPETFYQRETIRYFKDGTSSFSAYPKISVYDTATGSSAPVPPIANRNFTVSLYVYEVTKDQPTEFGGWSTTPDSYLSRVVDESTGTTVSNFGVRTPLAGECVTLSAGQGPGELKGTLTAVTDATGKATWTALQYTAATENLTLNVETGSDKGGSALRALTPLTGSVSTPILSGGIDATTTITAEPNKPARATISFTGEGVTASASADLPNGAYGTVHLWATSMPCIFEYQLVGGHSCDAVYLDMNTKQWDAFGAVVPGSELYSFASPAKLDVSCDQTRCPVPSASSYSLDLEYGTYPIKMDLRQDMGGYLDYDPTVAAFSAAFAPKCDTTLPIGTGVIADAAAQAVGYCVDVAAITRTAGGTLIRPILFSEDPRAGSLSK